MNEIKRLPNRDEVAESDTWDLSKLYPSDDAWETAFDQWESRIDGYESFRGKLSESPSKLAECLAFAKNLGANPEAVFEAIKDGMGGSQMMALMAPKMIAEDFNAGIEARLHAKDVGIALDTAKAQKLPLPCLEFVASQYEAIMDQGLGTCDSAILFEMLRRLK